MLQPLGMWEDTFIIVEILVSLAAALYLVGAGLSLHAAMNARTSQGAIAWAISLITLPYVTVPLYLVFGRGRFNGYVSALRKHRHHIIPLLNTLKEKAPLKKRHVGGRLQALERLASLPATGGNSLRILVDGPSIFPEMLDLIKNAERYILAQFYIVRDDSAGRRFADALIERVQAGVDVYFLYDEIGSYALPSTYIRKLSRAGVKIHRFHTTKGRSNRFQINFRNHRKILLADGKAAIVGGLNIGNEYNCDDPKFDHWRDTNALVKGPAVTCIQLSFVEDWHWAQGNIPDLFWEPPVTPDGKDVLILPTGPIDEMEKCSLFFTQSIHAAKERLWIASPYFVPDASVISALQLAALRGVDVRLMLPAVPDHKLIYWASFFYTDLVQTAGVKIFRYNNGFMHQKVMLIDERVATIGSANLDNRSFRLNFELTMAVFDESFARDIEAMFIADFDHCTFSTERLTDRSLGFQILSNLSRLLSPVL